MKNVFHKIIAGEIPCDKVFENERMIAFKDIHPQAPVHILIVPKKEISQLAGIQKEDTELLGEIMQVAVQLAREFGIEKGFRLLTNNGESAGQTVFQLHFHLLGGRDLGTLG